MDSCLDALRTIAENSASAEAEFRRYSERRLETMAAARALAYRRYHLLADMVETARPIAEQAACVAAQCARLLTQAGWSQSDAAYGEVRERIDRLATLVHSALHGIPDAEASQAAVLPALEAFETWYRERFGTDFPALLSAAPGSFQPLVDF